MDSSCSSLRLEPAQVATAENVDPLKSLADLSFGQNETVEEASEVQTHLKNIVEHKLPLLVVDPRGKSHIAPIAMPLEARVWGDTSGFPQYSKPEKYFTLGSPLKANSKAFDCTALKTSLTDLSDPWAGLLSPFKTPISQRTNTTRNREVTRASHHLYLGSIPTTPHMDLIISSTNSHSIIGYSDGFLYGVGSNSCGQIGQPKHMHYALTPQVLWHPQANTKVYQVAAGENFTLVLLDNGELLGCGSSTRISLSNYTHTYNLKPLSSLFPRNQNTHVHAVAARNNTILAVTEDGILWEWGTSLMVGINSKPVSVCQFPEGVRVRSIHLGDRECAVLDDRKRLWSWSMRNTSITPLLSTDESNSTLRVPNGTPYYKFSLLESSVLPPIRMVATGTRHTVLLGEDDKLYSFGDNDFGQLGRQDEGPVGVVPMPGVPEDGFKPKSISAGNVHSGCLTTDGQLMLWGSSKNNMLMDKQEIRDMDSFFGARNTSKEQKDARDHDDLPLGASVRSGIRSQVTVPKILFKSIIERVASIHLSGNTTIVVSGWVNDHMESEKEGSTQVPEEAFMTARSTE